MYATAPESSDPRTHLGVLRGGLVGRDLRHSGRLRGSLGLAGFSSVREGCRTLTLRVGKFGVQDFFIPGKLERAVDSLKVNPQV